MLTGITKEELQNNRKLFWINKKVLIDLSNKMTGINNAVKHNMLADAAIFINLLMV